MFYDGVVERVRALPGVDNAALTYSLPILGSNWWNVFNFPGKTREHWISVGEFVNSSVARKYWLNEDPIGKQIRQGFPTEPFGPWRTIVGVVGNIKREGVFSGSSR